MKLDHLLDELKEHQGTFISRDRDHWTVDILSALPPRPLNPKSHLTTVHRDGLMKAAAMAAMAGGVTDQEIKETVEGSDLSWMSDCSPDFLITSILGFLPHASNQARPTDPEMAFADCMVWVATLALMTVQIHDEVHTVAAA